MGKDMSRPKVKKGSDDKERTQGERWMRNVE